MVPIDPANFIVRDKKYPQNRKYPFAAAQAVNDLLAKDIQSANALFHEILAVGEVLANCFIKTHADRPQHGRYFVVRGSGFHSFTTQFENEPNSHIPYQVPVSDIFDEELKPHTQGMSHKDIKYRSPATGREIKLTRFSAAKNAVTGTVAGEMEHPDIMGAIDIRDIPNLPKYQLDHLLRDEDRWACIAQEFYIALEKDRDQSEREDAAIRFYCLLCHDCPVERGNATFARIALEYLAARISSECMKPFIIPYTKEGVDLHIQAKARDPDSFLKLWRTENNILFDSGVSSAKILQWQADVVKANHANRVARKSSNQLYTATRA